MLSALLNSIQTSLGTRGFLIGSVFPVLIFTVTNGLLSYRASPALAVWLTGIEKLQQQALLGTALLTAVIVAAFVLSAGASAILETLEGQHWPVTWLGGWFHRLQRAELRHLEERYQSSVRGLGDVRDGIDGNPNGLPPVAGWIDRLEEARRAGPRPFTCDYPASALSRWSWTLRGRTDVGIKEMSRVRRRCEAGKAIPAAVLGAAVEKLVPVLQRSSVDSDLKSGLALDRDCDQLIEAIRFSRNRYQAERILLFKLRKFQFPVNFAASKDQSAIVLAPTKMGNIARTIRSYAQNHYGFDLDVLWTRLQAASQSSDKFYGSLQDAKVQLDFFAACTWLAWLTTLLWLVLELMVFRSPSDFVVIGVVGPFTAVVMYRFSCRAYSVFADLMRTTVDLFRFKVLSDLHLPLPAGLEEENVVWPNLASVMGYENLERESGGRIDVTYKH